MLHNVVFGLPKNLLKLLPGAQSANGITAQVAANGLLTLSGTATADTTITLPVNAVTLGTGQYTASMTAKSGYATGTVTANVMQTATATQVITNGNFVNGATGYDRSFNGTMTVSNRVATFTCAGTSATYCQIGQTVNTASHAHKYFLSARVQVNQTTDHIELDLWDGASTSIACRQSNPAVNQWYTLYGVVATSSNSNSAGNLAILATPASGSTFKVDGTGQNGVMCIDMGADASNPLYNLTAVQMAALFPSYFYPTETVALPTPFASASSGSPATFTAQAGQTVPSVQLSILSGTSCQQYTFGLQVESGSTATGWVSPGTQGVIFYPATGETGTITNSGNVDAYPVITITGACANPSVTNDTTGKTIAVNIALGTKDVLVIDFRPATRGCYLNGKLAFGIKQGLGWIHCPPGDNVLTFNRDGYDTKRHCTIKLSARYL